MADNAAIEAAMAAAKARNEHSELKQPLPPETHSDLSPSKIEIAVKSEIEKYMYRQALHKKKDCSTERVVKWFRDMCAGSG